MQVLSLLLSQAISMPPPPPPIPSNASSLSKYYVHPNYIGPQAEQGRDWQHVNCTVGGHACAVTAAAACDAATWCHSFAVTKAGVYPAQLYTTDFNLSLGGHGGWILYSQSNFSSTSCDVTGDWNGDTSVMQTGAQVTTSAPTGYSHGTISGRTISLRFPYSMWNGTVSTDCNTIIWSGHDQWRRTGPYTPPPTLPPQSWDPEFYCKLKALAHEFAGKVLPARAPHVEVFDALRLHDMCNLTRPTEASNAGGRLYSEKQKTTLDEKSIFVDGMGEESSDTNPGTLARPVKTIGRGVQLAIANGAKAVRIRRGSYFLGGAAGEGTINMGHEASQLTIGGYNGERVVVSGGANLTSLKLNWTSSGPIWSARIPPNSIVSAGFSTLFVAGRRAIRARYPNLNPETNGMHTPEQTGYMDFRTMKYTGIRQQVFDTRDFSRAPFKPYTYGRFGGCDVNEPWAPNFTVWCGAWNGVGGLAYDDITAPNAVNPNSSNWPDGDAMKGAVVTVMRGSWPIWANYQWEVTSHDAANRTLSFGRGGWQFPRGPGVGGWWFIENNAAFLDEPGEWHYDSTTSMLLYYPPTNQTAALRAGTLDLVATQLETVITAQGNQSHPVVGVTLDGLELSHSTVSYLEPYEAPTGGGWSGHRGAMVVFEGCERPTVSNCVFDSPGGTGLLFSGYIRGATVRDSEFKFAGETAIMQLGRTNVSQPWDARAGDQPWGTQVINNYIHDVRIYGKAGAGFVQGLSANTNVTRNIIFSGPRAGMEWLDGFGGGNHFESNLLFALVRETGDHGATNSWDRDPYLTRNPDTGFELLGPALNTMTRNFVICDYQCVWPLDHDDGSNNYSDTFNFLAYGGAKNYMGHSKSSMGNVYVLPDAQPVEGQGLQAPTYGGFPEKRSCACNFGADKWSGFDEVFANNKCVMANTSSPIYTWARCVASNLTARDYKGNIIDTTYNNSFLVYRRDRTHLPPSSPNVTSPMLYLDCGFPRPTEFTLDEYEQLGYDLGSTAAVAPPSDTILAWGRKLLGLPPQ
jgi:hypothetical protein